MDGKNKAQVEECPTVLIADRVATEDAFGHRRIAHAISEMILKGESGGCAIALTGSWGSGKSTVVSLLAQELRDANEDIRIFVFDAWAHQGDPLRRTFLEKLISWCQGPPKWTKDETDWDEAIQTLSKRKEKSTVQSSPRLTRWGLAGALSLIVAPIALELYEKTHYEWHPIWESVALIASGLPIFVSVALVLTWYLSERSKVKEDRKPIPNLVFTSVDNEITSETSKTPDPTSVEFEHCYRRLLREALQGNKRQIIIVADNLDRVSHDDARSIWATLRIFFEPSVNSSDDWHKRVWLLAPFDPDAINDLWETKGSNGESAKSSKSRHFLEKTFQATFTVPPVILSNRREYLLSQLRFAFPNHTEAEFHNIFRLYDRLATGGKEPPTPRNIKIFVNKLGSIHRQWQHRIPFPQQAAFILWSEQNENILAALPGQGTSALLPNLPATISALLDDGWPRNFVALYFNVDPKDAYQVLLSEPTRRAIQARDKSKLAELEKNPGFQEVIESTVENLCGASTSIDSSMVADAAVAFSGLKGEGRGYENCKAHLCRTALSFEEWDSFDAAVAEGIVWLIQMMPESSDISRLVRSVANSLKVIAPANRELNIASWCEGLAVVIPALKSRDQNAVKRDFRVNAGPELYLDVIKEVEKSPQADLIRKYLIPTAGMKPVFEYLSKMVLEGKWNVWAVTAVDSLLKIDPKCDTNSLINAFRPRITTNHLSLQLDVPRLLETALQLSFHSTEAEEFLNAAAKGDSLFQILGLLPANGEYTATAACILPMLGNAIQVQQGYSQPNTTQWSTTQGKQRALALIRAPKSNQVLMQKLSWACLGFHHSNKWREICEAMPDQAAFVSEFLRIRLSGENARKIDFDEVIDHTNFWRSVVGPEDFASSLDFRAKTGEFSAALIKRPFGLGKLDLYAVALAGNECTEYRSFLSKALGELTEEEWDKALREETDLVGIAIRLQPTGLILEQTFQDALAAHAEWSFSQDEFGALAENWGRLTTLLGSEGQAVLKQRLWNSFNSENGHIVGVIPYYGELLSTIVLKKGPGSAFNRIVQIINRHEESEIKWLTGTLSRWIPRSEEGKASQSDWRKRVEKLLGEDSGALNDGERSALNALREVLEPKSRPPRSSS